MKPAKQWYVEGGLNDDASEIKHRRLIQADALRHAAMVVRESKDKESIGGIFRLLEAEADKLEA